MTRTYAVQQDAEGETYESFGVFTQLLEHGDKRMAAWGLERMLLFALVCMSPWKSRSKKQNLPWSVVIARWH